MANILQQRLVAGIEKSTKMYIQDINALSEDQFKASPGGKTRKPIDFSYEVAAVNDRVAKRLHNEDPGPWPFEGWAKAPESHQSKEAIINYLEETSQRIVAGIKQKDDEELVKIFQIDGNDTSFADMADLCAFHTGYHDGQLNYAQAFNGDEEVNWS